MTYQCAFISNNYKYLFELIYIGFNKRYYIVDGLFQSKSLSISYRIVYFSLGKRVNRQNKSLV